MSLDIDVTHEAQQTLVAIRGSASLGQLCSLLQVVAVDSASWPFEAVVLDFSGLEQPFTEAERAMLREQAQTQLARMRLVTLRWDG